MNQLLGIWWLVAAAAVVCTDVLSLQTSTWSPAAAAALLTAGAVSSLARRRLQAGPLVAAAWLLTSGWLGLPALWLAAAVVAVMPHHRRNGLPLWTLVVLGAVQVSAPVVAVGVALVLVVAATQAARLQHNVTALVPVAGALGLVVVAASRAGWLASASAAALIVGTLSAASLVLDAARHQHRRQTRLVRLHQRQQRLERRANTAAHDAAEAQNRLRAMVHTTVSASHLEGAVRKLLHTLRAPAVVVDEHERITDLNAEAEDALGEGALGDELARRAVRPLRLQDGGHIVGEQVCEVATEIPLPVPATAQRKQRLVLLRTGREAEKAVDHVLHHLLQATSAPSCVLNTYLQVLDGNKAFGAWAGTEPGVLVYDLVDEVDQELLHEALELALPSSSSRGLPVAEAGPIEMYPGQRAMVRCVLIPDVSEGAFSDAGRILLTFLPLRRSANDDVVATAPIAVRM